MSLGRISRLAVVAALLVAGFVWIQRTTLDLPRVNLYIAAAIGAITIVYALLTYEILIQNQAMAQAAVDSTKLTERGLRFSYTPNLHFRTVNTKDPFFRENKEITPFDNDDYRRALAEQGNEPQGQEFVFAVVKNVGRGAATNLNVEAQYKITDSRNVNKESVVTKSVRTSFGTGQGYGALHIFF